MSETRELVLRPDNTEMVRASDFMPLLTVDEAVERKRMMNDYIGRVLREGDDYGAMPGEKREGAKKVLLKPGAEKLCSIFGITPQYGEDKIIEDWTGADHAGEPLFYYSYRCQLSRGGRFMGEAIGSCNSWEAKYRYRWVRKEIAELRPDWEDLPKRGGRRTLVEPVFALERRETTGKYGKPAEHWQAFEDAKAAGTAKSTTMKKKDGSDMAAISIEVDEVQYRIPNPDIPDVINTCQKMAQKRALVAAVLVVTNCSDAFTQDLEDQVPDDSQPHSHQPAATVPAEALLPAELAGLFSPDAPPRSITTAFHMCQREILLALPQNGEEEYIRVLKLHGIEKGGPKPTIKQAREACAHLWTLAKQLQAAGGPHVVRDEQPVQERLGVNMSDVPYQGVDEDVPF